MASRSADSRDRGALRGAGRAEFRRRKLGIDSHLEVTVSPEDDAEIRRITLSNQGSRARTLELTSAAELSLARRCSRPNPVYDALLSSKMSQYDA